MTAKKESYDAVIIGSGPNGLAAGITLAKTGKHVLILESSDTPGGGMRSAELTLPGYIHDVCSAVHPFGVSSPFFLSLPLQEYGVRWIHAPSPLAHPFDNGEALLLKRSVHETAEQLGADTQNYIRLFEKWTENASDLFADILGPLQWPDHPILLAQFGLRALQSADGLARRVFSDPKSQALFAGLAAHSVVPLTFRATAAFGLVLGTIGHAAGWPVVEGGTVKLADALVTLFKEYGGELQTNCTVTSMRDLPPAKAYLFDVTPRQLVQIAQDDLPAGYVRKLRQFRYGPGVFKMDFALKAAIPWRAPECRLAATVHLGDSAQDITAGEASVWSGKTAKSPFVLVAQPSLFDRTRAPDGMHTAWAYCHVPHASAEDYSEAIIRQIERFAPGFREVILAQHTMAPFDLQAYNANYIGGDIGAGANILSQVFTRPVARISPYTTPNKRIFLCSASTPPGGGIHGMCGFHAAQVVLRRAF